MRIVVALAIDVLWTAAGRALPQSAVTIYDPNPDHLWNRLHATFFVRDDFADAQRLPDALDRPFWYHTSYLLSNPSHKRALRILDEFLQARTARI
jgi:hypothetical protein